MLGQFQSTAYFDLDAPVDSSNILKGCASCYFDSLALDAKFSGGYFGDTTAPFILHVNQLTQQISTSNGGYGYNIDHCNYYSNAAGVFYGIIHPSERRKMHIRLSDDIGMDLFNKVKNNDDAVGDNTLFQQYIKGFCFTGDTTADNTVYYFKPEKDSALIHLYYHKNEILPQQYAVTFPLNKSHQFNGYATNYAGTNLAAFTPKKTLTFSSVQTNNYIYLYANGGIYPKFRFPFVYSLKELNSYVSVVSATLEIYPLTGSFGYRSFYTLPPVLNAYIIDEYGDTQGDLTNSSTSSLQTGDLAIDYIYNQNTKYTYNVASYINSVLQQGKYSSLYLFLQPPGNAADSIEQRLILDNSSFKLKLNVLGL